MDAAEVLIPVTLFISSTAMIFGIVYLKTRQNLAMIERGMNPKIVADSPAPYKNLKWALLLMGAGVGLFLAYLLDTFLLPSNMNHHHDNNAAVYFSLIAIGGGAGLFISYRIEKKWLEEYQRQQKNL